LGGIRRQPRASAAKRPSLRNFQTGYTVAVSTPVRAPQEHWPRAPHRSGTPPRQRWAVTTAAAVYGTSTIKRMLQIEAELEVLGRSTSTRSRRKACLLHPGGLPRDEPGDWCPRSPSRATRVARCKTGSCYSDAPQWGHCPGWISDGTRRRIEARNVLQRQGCRSAAGHPRRSYRRALWDDQDVPHQRSGRRRDSHCRLGRSPRFDVPATRGGARVRFRGIPRETAQAIIDDGKPAVITSSVITVRPGVAAWGAHQRQLAEFACRLSVFEFQRLASAEQIVEHEASRQAIETDRLLGRARSSGARWGRVGLPRLSLRPPRPGCDRAWDEPGRSPQLTKSRRSIESSEPSPMGGVMVTVQRIRSRQVSWWGDTSSSKRGGTTRSRASLPVAELASWCELGDGDPRKLLPFRDRGESTTITPKGKPRRRTTRRVAGYVLRRAGALGKLGTGRRYVESAIEATVLRASRAEVSQ